MQHMRLGRWRVSTRCVGQKDRGLSLAAPSTADGDGKARRIGGRTLVYFDSMPAKAFEWLRRIHFGEGRTVGLYWGMELWKWDASLYETAESIRDALGRKGLDNGRDSVLTEATLRLLDDAVHATSGIELAWTRLHVAMDRLQEAYSGRIAEMAESGTPWHIADPAGEEGWYAVEELLAWARTMADRLRRRAVATGFPDQGLIPAMADGARRDAVIDAKARLLAGPVGEARYLANLNLHMQSIKRGTPLCTLRSGRIMLPFPDGVTKRVDHSVELTYADDRDAVSFADELMASVERFMDEMIGAFEKHLPERFKAAATE